MASGYYPLSPRNGAGRKLAKISKDLAALLSSVGDDHGAHVPDCLPDPCENDQTDNAATDGGYVAELFLASKLIAGCLEKSDCQCAACQADGGHYSSCAVHREPAEPNGPCDCGLI